MAWSAEPVVAVDTRPEPRVRPLPSAPGAPSSAASGTAHDVSADAALTALRNDDGAPLLVDLDETLYLRNSTEDFLDSAWPALPALLLLRLLDALKPWRYSGGLATRDVWRVRLVALLLPWTWRRWRRRVDALAAEHSNHRLLAVLALRRTPPVIVTIGFKPIVTPLVSALGLPRARIVAARLDRFADRRDGKLQLAVAALGADTIARATVLTDSPDDAPLLERCAQPLRTVWPEARFRPALSRVYLPGQYLTQVKRPGEHYIVRGILQEDFAFWVLASIAHAAFPVLHLAGLLFLLLSFWAIYECGYVDNDRIAARYEKDPKLSTAFGVAEVATPRWQPWLWAGLSGAAAIMLLRWPARMLSPMDLAAWTAALVTTYGGFFLYNRLDKATRIWLFPALQFARSAAFVVLVPIGPAAAVALGAHVIARWIPYYVYRISGREWPSGAFFLSRLLFYCVLWSMLAMTQGLAEVLTPTALALLVWNLYRARRDLLEVLRSARRIDRPGPPR